MPQFNSIVLKDGQSTPVDHTFTPRGIEDGVATLVETNGVPIGESRITLSQSRNSNGRIRAVVKFAVPVVQDVVVGGVTKPTVVRVNYVDLTFNFENTSSVVERATMMNYVATAFASTQSMIKNYIVNLEGLY